MNTTFLWAFVVLASAPLCAVAQSEHSGKDSAVVHDAQHQGHPPGKPILTEPGQGAFAALSEVVQLLETDPETNWASVDLAGLRAHLVDMDRVVSDTVVTQVDLKNGITAGATGDAKTIAALRRMVPAHAKQLAMDNRWSVEAVKTATGVTLRVTSDDPAVAARIKGLGFFGLMASQDHHRAHHLSMARGANAQGH